ncbi:MAG: hypothetical protein GX610_03730, partial [Rhodococcus sp.]|nr:hypothetical protein [Rhodococcus sp. (in: high G+C Gram-positive bacteria)]
MKQWTQLTLTRRGPPESPQQRITLFNGKSRAQELQAEVDRLRVLIDRMGIGGVDALDAETARLNDQVAALHVQHADLNAQIAAARVELVETQDTQELQTVGLYR